MTILVTGVAGFIGYHVARKLAERGERVLGIDSMDDAYSVDLKRRRLVQLSTFPGFKFTKVDLTDREALSAALKGESIRTVVHLAARANVRGGLENPRAYLDSNLLGHMNILEHCRHAGALEGLVYSSSSSVYGRRNNPPFREDAATDQPTSFYAATKKSQEMMSEVYAEMFSIPQIGLRLFSAYGPWGRPDTAYWLFTEAILRGRPIHLFNSGRMYRDFIYIDDVTSGFLAAVDAPAGTGAPLHRIYNVGNGRPVALTDMVAILEDILGRRATVETMPMQPGETMESAADISAIQADLKFRPRIGMEEGLRRFVEWFKRHAVK